MALITGTVNRLTEQVDYWQFLVDIENTSASKENVVRQSVFSRLAFFVGWEIVAKVLVHKAPTKSVHFSG